MEYDIVGRQRRGVLEFLLILCLPVGIERRRMELGSPWWCMWFNGEWLLEVMKLMMLMINAALSYRSCSRAGAAILAHVSLLLSPLRAIVIFT